jgi:hypothetical protein
MGSAEFDPAKFRFPARGMDCIAATAAPKAAERP